MARTSHRRFDQKQAVDKCSEKIFKAAIYTRISREKKDKPSNSIENQIMLCQRYVKDHEDLSLVGVYQDRMKTGTNFERPEFEQLMDNVRKGKVNCIIVKDLSRFGRNYTELGNYIEKIFPFLGVRFISVNDNFDTFSNVDTNKSLEVILKNIVNESYAMDISQKVKSSNQIRGQNGCFLTGDSAYGYNVKKDHLGIRKLYIDEPAAKIVRSIFQWAADGLKVSEIRQKLYENQIHTRSDYKKYGHVIAEQGETLKMWLHKSVVSVLNNDVYIGTLSQWKTINKEIRIQTQLPIDQWKKHEEIHEPIISKELFLNVQKLLPKLKTPRKKVSKYRLASIFDGKVYSMAEMLPMNRKLSQNSISFYQQLAIMDSIYTRYLSVSENVIFKIVVETLRLAGIEDAKSTHSELNKCRLDLEKESSSFKKKLNFTQKKIQILETRRIGQYEKYVLGEQVKEVYLKENRDILKKIQDLEQQKKLFVSKLEGIESRKLEIQDVTFLNPKDWTKEFIDSLIKKILIGKYNAQLNGRIVEVYLQNEDKAIQFKIGKRGGIKDVNIRPLS